MRILLDTHIILWAVVWPDRISRTARSLLEDPENDLAFSSVNIWEIAVKRAKGRQDFDVDAAQIRDGLLSRSIREIALNGEHAIATLRLPLLHHDPFDRIMVAQAMVEKRTFLTSDAQLEPYGEPVLRV